MTARIIDGKVIAADLRARVAAEVARVQREHRLTGARVPRRRRKKKRSRLPFLNWAPPVFGTFMAARRSVRRRQSSLSRSRIIW